MGLARKFLCLPLWLRGFLAGLAFWCIAAAIFHLAQWLNFPPPSISAGIRTPISAVISYCGIIAYPIGLGGWCFVWGDNGPPYALFDNMIFNIVVGAVWWGIVGMIIWLLAARWIMKRKHPPQPSNPLEGNRGT
jgi:hypothetical protein